MVSKERRCNLFDDNGRPRRLVNGTKGCPRDASVCHFAHPHEREWETANPSKPPRPALVADKDSDFLYITDKRGKSFSDTQAHRESSPHRKDNMTTSPHPRRSTFDNAMDSKSSARARSRSPSAASDQLERPRRDKDKYHRGDYPPRREYDWSRRSRSRSRDRGKERVDIPRKSSPPRSHAVTDGRVGPPPEPSKPPPMQPPPPPPKLPEVPKEPSFASNQQRTGSAAAPPPKGLKSLSIDEQRKAWHERIDLMFNSITSRRDYTKLESDLTHIRVLSDSSLIHSMADAKLARIHEQKIALELEMEKKRREINEIIHKLISSEFWPVLKAPHVAELEKGLGEVRKHVLEVKGILDDLKSSCAALLKTRGESVPASDWTQDSDRPSKRRKLEGDGDTSRHMHEDTARELETFRDKLSIMDRQLADLENDITQRDQIVSDEIDLLLTARLEEEDALYPPIKPPSEVPRSEIEAVVDAKNKELHRAVAATGDDIGALATEVAELITKVNTLEAKCQALEAENEEIKNKLAQAAPKLAIPEHALARRDKEIEAIAAALQAYISQAPTSQSSGDLPSAEYIIEALDSQLDGLFREKFCATLVKIQQEVFDKVQESHDHTLNTVSPKVMLLLKMVNFITARVGKPDMDAINE